MEPSRPSSRSQSRTIAGGCLCGRVTYRSQATPLFSGFCYCRDCRKVSGAGRLPYFGLPSDELVVTGEPAHFVKSGGSGADIARFFCPACGTTLGSRPAAAEGITLLYAGTLNEPALFQPTSAIFLCERADWEPAPSGLLCHGRGEEE